MLNQSKKNWNAESPKFLKYFFKDCIQNQEKMTSLVESQKRQIEEENNQNSCNRVFNIDSTMQQSKTTSQKQQVVSKNINAHPSVGSSSNSNAPSNTNNSNNYNNSNSNSQPNANFVNNPLDFSKVAGQMFSAPIMPHIPSEFQTKTPSFDVTELIECLAELKPAHILSGKKKNSSSHINAGHGANGSEWNVFEQDVPNLIKKYSSEGYKALMMQDYKQALICLKKSEILMNAFVNKVDGKIESEILLFIKANLGICFYRIGLLQEAFTNFCICLAHLKKSNGKGGNGYNLHQHPNIINASNENKSSVTPKSNSNQNIISNQYKKRSYSNLPSIDQAEYLQVLAQKLKKKKLKGDLLLQACIVLSEQGKHEEALVVGNKGSKLQLNYLIDTLTACYHTILQLIKERDQALSASDGYGITKAQTSRRGNSAHQPSTHHTHYFNQQQKDNKNANLPYNIFDGDFVQELQSPMQSQSQGFFKNANIKERIAYQEKLVPILKEVMKRTNDLHQQYVNPSKLKIIDVMNKIINNSNMNTNNTTRTGVHQTKNNGIQGQSPSSSASALPQDKEGQNGTENHLSFEVSLYERPDLEFLFKTITSSSHWILKTNILSLLQLKAVSLEDTQIYKTSMDQEICIDSILSKLSHLCVSFYCISTETRFINDQKKNKQKENPQLQAQNTNTVNQMMIQNQSKYAKFLQNLNYEVSESENWLSRSLEIAYVFLPHDMPLVGQIVSVHNKFHNVNKIVIKEDENEHIDEEEDDYDQDQSYDEDYSKPNQVRRNSQLNNNNNSSNNYYSSEYTSPLVTLPGGSKSNFFIPLVRKIKPKITKNPSPKDEIEEEITKLYSTYTTNFVQPQGSDTIDSNPSAQICISAPQTERSESKKIKQIPNQVSQSQNYSLQQAFEQQIVNQKALKEKQFSNNSNNIASAAVKKQIAEEIQQSLKISQQQQKPLSKDYQQQLQNQNIIPKNQIQNIPPPQAKKLTELTQVVQENQQITNKKSNPSIQSKVQQQQPLHQLSNTTPAGMAHMQQIQQQGFQHHQQIVLPQKNYQQSEMQPSNNQNIQRLSKTTDFQQQLSKQIPSNHNNFDEQEDIDCQDDFNLEEFQIMNQNPQIFLQNNKQQVQQPQKSNNASGSGVPGGLGDSKYDQIRKSQERKLQDKYYQQYQQLILQRNQNNDKRQNSQEQKQRSQSNGQSSGAAQSQINNLKQYQQAFNNTNILLFNSSNQTAHQAQSNPQGSQTSSGQKKKKRVFSLAQETSSSYSQQQLQSAQNQFNQQLQQHQLQLQDLSYLNSSNYQTPSNSNQIKIDFSRIPNNMAVMEQPQQQPNSQQKQLKKILSKPLSAERKYRTIDNSLNSIKNMQNSSNNFINNVNLLLDQMNYPQSAKNSSSTNPAANQSSARQQIQQLSQTFEVKRKPSQGQVPPAAKTSRSNSLNKNAKPSNQKNTNSGHPSSAASTSSTIANSLITNSSLLNQATNNQKQQQSGNSQNDKQLQKAMKNNYIQDHILNEIFDINNIIKPTHNRGQSMQVQPSSTTSAGSQSHQQYLQEQQQLINQQYLQNSSSHHVQQQLINQLTASNNSNSKRLNSKENVQRSNSSNQSGQRKNKKNLDIQVNQQMMQFSNPMSNDNETTGVSKSSRNSSNPSNFLQDNYINLFKGSQSTKSAQNPPNAFLNQPQNLINKYSSQTTKNSQKDASLINTSTNGSINMSLLQKNQTPKQQNIPSSSGSTSTTSAATNDKKLHMLRKFRSTVGKVPEDLLKKK